MPKFLEYLRNIFSKKQMPKLNTASIKFKDEELQKYFMKKFKKEEISIEDLASLRNISYSGKGEKVFQEDIDNLSKYCDISNGQLFIDNLDLTGISFENLKVGELMLKKSKIQDTKYPSKDILKYLAIDNSVGINLDDFNEYNLESFYIAEMNVSDLEVAKRFKNTLKRLSVFDNPLDNLNGIEEFEKLEELSVAYTNVDMDSKDEIVKLRENGIKVELLGTPLEEEINKLYKIKKEEEENKRLEEEGIIEIDDEFLKYLNHSGIFGQVTENRKITKKDIERLNIKSKEDDLDLLISSKYAEEFLKINDEVKLELRKLSIDIGKGDSEFNLEEFLKKKNSSSLVELEIETPSSIESQPQEFLSSRYGITYNFENNQYHYDDIKYFNNELNTMINGFKNQDRNLETVKEMYKYIKENIKLKEQKTLGIEPIQTLSGEEVANVEIKEDMQPYRKLEYILKNHSTDYFGMRNLMYHMLLSLGYDADIEFKDIEFELPNKVTKSCNIDLKIDDNKYSLDLDNKDCMIILDDETMEKDVVYKDNYKEHKIENEDIER